MKKIQDLKPHEAVEITKLIDAEKILKSKGLIPMLPFYVTYDEVKLISAEIPSHVTVVYHANEFITKKKNWKKEAFREIARLDSEVNELRHLLAKDIPVAVTEDVKLEVGKWYISHDGALNFKGEIYDYGINAYGLWVYDNYWFLHNPTNWKPATPEQVKSALIKEAERRGYKKGVTIKDLHTKTEDVIINMTWHSNSADLRTDIEGKLSYCIYHKGKWAEIVEQPKEIDWSVPGQLVCKKSKQPFQYIFMTTGQLNDKEGLFSGITIETEDKKIPIGSLHDDLPQNLYEPYTGEPIILKP